MYRVTRYLVVSLAVVAVVSAGCAKRAGMTQTTTPPPVAQVESKSAPEAVQPTPPAPRPPVRAAQRSGTTRGDQGTARPAPSEFANVADLKEIHFDFDKHEIRKSDAEILDGNAQWLKSHDDQLVLIEGHCDERGTVEYNLALGERRAKSTLDYLVSRGVQSARISIVSYGEERPACADHSEGCWAKNRRAHFLVKPR